jgi:hypothetical protein
MTSEGRPFVMRIETGKVREFARATGSTHPEYTTGDDPISPVTFLMSSAFWQGSESSVWPADRDLSRVLHGGQEFVFPNGPPRAGSILTGQARAGEPVIKQGKRGGTMSIVETVTEYRYPDGTIAAQVIATTIETSQPAGDR